MPKEIVWRIKGFVQLIESHSDLETAAANIHIVNWAFGRFELTPYQQSEGFADLETPRVLLTVMGERGEVSRSARRLAENLGAVVS